MKTNYRNQHGQLIASANVTLFGYGREGGEPGK
jgi:hypothetical protein